MPDDTPETPEMLDFVRGFPDHKIAFQLANHRKALGRIPAEQVWLRRIIEENIQLLERVLAERERTDR